MNIGASAPRKLQYLDPRVILQSKFVHGLIFNLLCKAVHTHGISENIKSLSVFLLELALSLTQTDYSGKEHALSSSTTWYIVHKTSRTLQTSYPPTSDTTSP